CGFASVPRGGGATVAAADPGSPSSQPRSSGSHSSTSVAECAPRLLDPSSASGLACVRSRSHLQSTTLCPTHSAAARTSVRTRWLPSLLVPSGLCSPKHDRNSPPLRDGQAAFPETLRFRYPRTLFVETQDENPLL